MFRSLCHGTDMIPKFSSKDEEIDFWKSLSLKYKKGCQEAREELLEFQEGSRELEAELEAQLGQAEHRIKDLHSENHRLKNEVETLKAGGMCLQPEETFVSRCLSGSRLRSEDTREAGASYTQSYKQISVLEDDLGQTRSIKEQLHKYVRELEQSNDDLERAKRAASDHRVSGELRAASEPGHREERLPESELDEKESLLVSVQRLKDEARDLRQELAVRERQPTSPGCQLPVRPHKQREDGHSRAGLPLPPCHPLSKGLDNAFANPAVLANGYGSNSPLTPSARISALNIALESKLAACRNFAKDQKARKALTLDNSNALNANTAHYSQALHTSYFDKALQCVVVVVVDDSGAEMESGHLRLVCVFSQQDRDGHIPCIDSGRTMNGLEPGALTAITAPPTTTSPGLVPLAV
ncbi:hypothetical protein INR49_005816 [Caranx melampygus]|nr:hypothetical protein INR49_005816 [Caranx melampygus]